MGWLAILALAAAIGLTLWRYAGLSRGALELVMAALLLGLAGYAWQGSPGRAGAPHRPPRATLGEDSAFAKLRSEFMGRFGREALWLDFADAMHRQGANALAVKAVQSGLMEKPESPALWTGLGNALTLAGDGLVSPAARFAFDKAAALAPGEPAPRFFLGLALIRSGQVEEGAGVWRALLASAPADAPWRERVAVRLAVVDSVLNPPRPQAGEGNRGEAVVEGSAQR